MYKHWRFAVGLLWGAMSFSLSAADPAQVEAQPVELVDAWVRALPPTQKTTAAYLTVKNPAGVSQEISGARSELAGRVEMHRTREVDGLMRMERVQRVTLAPGAALEFTPGGLHLMLLELERMPAEGEFVPLCLELTTGASVCTRAPVRRANAGADRDPHRHH